MGVGSSHARLSGPMSTDFGYCLGAYWMERHESAGSWAARLLKCLSDIEPMSESFSGWRSPAASRAEAERMPVIPLHAGALEWLVRKGTVHDGSHVASGDHGAAYNISLWNGGSGPDVAGIAISCGQFGSTSGVPNSFVMHLPEGDSRAALLYQPARLLSLLSAVASAWEPDWAVLWSNQLDKRLLSKDLRRPGQGWLTYIASTRPLLVPVPRGCVVHSVEGRGTIIGLGPDILIPVDAAAIVARELVEALDAS
ncbi:MAG: Imm52 family immunity protein [Acidimicrobiales bacterium]